MNVTGDSSALSKAEPAIGNFLQSLSQDGAKDQDWSNQLALANEAITVPTQVFLCFQSIETLSSIVVPRKDNED